MGRKILAVVVALIVAFGVIMIVQMLNALVVLPPSPETMGDPAKLREYVAGLPMTAFVVVLLGYILGSFAGGYIVTKMSLRESPGISLPIVIGVILTIGGALNFFVLMPGQPIWFTTAALITYIPVSLIGHRMAT